MKLLRLLLAIVPLTSIVSAHAADGKSIPYKTVQDALVALQKNPDAVLTEYEGWKVFNVKGDGVYVLWSFTPVLHPANPAVVKRTIMKKDGNLFIHMDSLCESSRLFCDSLVEEFELINDRIRQRESSGS